MHITQQFLKKLETLKCWWNVDSLWRKRWSLFVDSLSS